MRGMLGALLAFVALGAWAAGDGVEGLKDPSWPRRAAAFLESQHGVSQKDWTLLSEARKQALFRDWTKQREDALQARRIVLLQGKPPTEAQARHMRLLVTEGFLDSREVQSLNALRTAGGAALFEAAAIEPSMMPAAARGDAGRQFRERFDFAQRGRSDLAVLAPGKGLPPTVQADLEVAYRTAQQMVVDPQGFEKSRPDLVPRERFDSAQRERRGRLRQQLGHLFTTAGRLRASGRLEFRTGSDKELNGAFGGTDITDERDPVSANRRWKIIVRLHEKFRNADPALLAPTLVHELQHAHNDARRIERYGLAVAMALEPSQEEEQRAFIAESLLAPAYASAFELARREKDAALHIRIGFSAGMEELRSQDTLRYRAKLKDAGFGLQNLAALRRRAELELRKTGTAPSQEARAVVLRSLLRLIDEEKRRGVDLL